MSHIEWTNVGGLVSAAAVLYGLLRTARLARLRDIQDEAQRRQSVDKYIPEQLHAIREDLDGIASDLRDLRERISRLEARSHD